MTCAESGKQRKSLSIESNMKIYHFKMYIAILQTFTEMTGHNITLVTKRGFALMVCHPTNCVKICFKNVINKMMF